MLTIQYTLASMALTPAHLRTLAEITRTGSFSRAAESLHLSQPALSHHIRLLEEDLGTSLLERVGKRAFPTQAGRILLDHAARALAQLEAARTAIHGLRGRVTGAVRLGTGATASIYMLPPLLRRLQRRYPGVEVTVVTGNSVDIAAAVVANRHDVAVVTLPVTSRDLTIAPFCVDPLVAIAPTRSPLAGRRAVTPRELAQERLIVYERGGTIRRIVEEWFRRVDLAPRVAMELGNAEAIKRLVSAGLGLAVTSAVSVQDEVRRGKLAAIPLRPTLHRRLGIIRRRDKPISPALQAVLGVLTPTRRTTA
jgi:DNA-binding transcriptional LysR family regulator